MILCVILKRNKDFIMIIHSNTLIKILLFFVCFSLSAKENTEENYELYANKIVSSFARDMKKELGLICIGEGGCMPHDVQKMSVKFIAYQRATVEQARKLLIQVTEKFIKAINADEEIRPFLRNYPIVEPFRAGVSISFNQKNNRRYTDGSVAYVLQVKNRIFYEKEDPSSRNGLSTIFEEAYEDALKIVQSQKKEIEQGGHD